MKLHGPDLWVGIGMDIEFWIRWYWPGICGVMVLQDLPCVSVKLKKGTQRSYGKGYILAPISLCKVAMDIVGSLPQSSKDNECILVVCDYATQYHEVGWSIKECDCQANRGAGLKNLQCCRHTK